MTLMWNASDGRGASSDFIASDAHLNISGVSLNSCGDTGVCRVVR